MATKAEVLSAYAESRRRRLRRLDAGKLTFAFLVGQAAPAPVPGTTHHPLFPLPARSAGGRLHAMSGWSLEDWFTEFNTFNTLEHFPGRAAKGDQFPLREAREAAARHEFNHCLRERVAVFIGKANAGCYSWTLPEPLTLTALPEGGHWAWMPHTSGIVPFWNDGGNRDRVRALFEEVHRVVGG